MRDHEDWNMWGSYSERGVAIKSSVDSLRQALLRDENNLGIHFAEVEYLDSDNEEIGYDVAVDKESMENFADNDNIEDFWESDQVSMIMNRPLVPFGFKRKYFGSDNEFRAITLPNAIDPLDIDLDHIYCSVYLHELIDKIVISPKISEWEKKCIKSVLTNRYGLTAGEWVVDSNI